MEEREKRKREQKKGGEPSLDGESSTSSLVVLDGWMGGKQDDGLATTPLVYSNKA